MKKFYKAVSVLVCIGCLSFFSIPLGLAINEMEQVAGDMDQIIKLSLINRIKQKVSTDAGSIFVDLTPEAVKIGLPEAKLYGSVKQEELVDKTTRMYIKWHSIGIPTGSNSHLIDILPSPLLSQVRTPDENIEVGEIITATGDLQGLIDKFLELKERAKEDEPKHILEEKEEDEEDEEGGLSPDSGGGGGTSAGGDYDSDSLDTANEFSTNMITSNWEECDPRIAQAEGKVYRQSKQVEVDEEGVTVNTGPCVDYGGSVNIQKEYGAPCTIIYDFEGQKAYEQYQEYAVLDGETITVTTCSNDFKRSYDIYSRPDACGIRHDFVAGRSIIQEELFYMNNAGEETKITDCIDSNKAYAHYLTGSTCSPFIDRANSKVILYNRTAYKLDDGTIEFASECRPVDDGEKELFEAFCEDKYEHDFAVGQSYYRTKDYYLDDDTNEPVYLTDCTRSTTISFPHIYNGGGCGIINDDEKLKSIQKTSTSIDTPEGIIEINPCQDSGVAIPYTYTGIQNRSAVFTKSGTWTVPATIKNISITLVAGGSSGGKGSNGESNSPNNFSGFPGGGQNGGKGEVWTTGNYWGGGGGGSAGEIIQKNVTVKPGAKISVTIGGSNQNSKFASYATARTGYGAAGARRGGSKGDSSGGNGANGYGSAKVAQNAPLGGWTESHQASYKRGMGGVGYGAGGGGGFGKIRNFGISGTAGGAGGKGYLKITWTVNVYRRADDTIYKGQP